MSEEYPDWQDELVKVVCNSERVCSIWPAERKNALGWEDVGFSGTREECLEYVKAHCDAYCRLPKPAESLSAPGHPAGQSIIDLPGSPLESTAEPPPAGPPEADPLTVA